MSELSIPTCDIDGCNTEIPGLDDGYEFDRGLVCTDCIEFNDRHSHFPDEEREHCIECTIDNGAVRHDCDETSVDSVIVTPGDLCPCCNEVIES